MASSTPKDSKVTAPVGKLDYSVLAFPKPVKKKKTQKVVKNGNQ